MSNHKTKIGHRGCSPKAGLRPKMLAKKHSNTGLTDADADELRAVANQALGGEVSITALAKIVTTVNRIVQLRYKRGYCAGWKQGMEGGTERISRGDVPNWMWDTRHIRNRRSVLARVIKHGPKKEEEKPA